MTKVFLGIDPAKNKFNLHGFNAAGRPAMERTGLARIIYAMLTKDREYTDQGRNHFEERYRQCMIHNLTRRALQLCMVLDPVEPEPVTKAT